MTPYATPADLEAWARFYEVEIPAASAEGDPRERLLELATADVIRFLGAAWPLELVEPEQAQALIDATAIQATFRAAQGGELSLGMDDGIASMANISFSLRTPPRFSPEASEALAGMGLLAKSGTVAPPLDVFP